MKPVDAYLVLYNLASAAGWAMVLALTLKNLSAGASPAANWADISTPLSIVQSTMFMEVLHTAAGMVRSPLFVVFNQVSGPLHRALGRGVTVKPQATRPARKR